MTTFRITPAPLTAWPDLSEHLPTTPSRVADALLGLLPNLGEDEAAKLRRSELPHPLEGASRLHGLRVMEVDSRSSLWTLSLSEGGPVTELGFYGPARIHGFELLLKRLTGYNLSQVSARSLPGKGTVWFVQWIFRGVLPGVQPQ